MQTVTQSVTIAAPPRVVYAALATTEGQRAFTGAETAISSEVGGRWSAWGGGIHGFTLHAEQDARLVLAWRAAGWAPQVYTLVSIELTAVDEGTQVDLVHTGIPEGMAAHLDAGWHARYWEPLSAWLRTQSPSM